ncbi:MAG: hypothetical protein NVS2B5_11350 [Beijerinckiaceae bacterium]
MAEREVTRIAPRSGKRSKAVALIAQVDVETADGRFVATSREPWLRLCDTGAFRPGGFVEITYRASLFDDPVRPILRFCRRNGAAVDRFLPGPVAGAGIWVGRVPHGTTEIWISPTRHPGRFDFVIEDVRRRGSAALWLEALWRSPRYALSALFYGLPGFIDEYDMNLDWALGFEPLSFERWRARRARALDLAGIDVPRCDWARGQKFHIMIRAIAGDEAGMAASIASLGAQKYPNWRLYLEGTAAPPAFAGDGRIEHGDGDAGLADAAPGDLVVVLRSGDRLEPHALACAAEHAARRPGEALFYADEAALHGDGSPAPILKPDWSPLLQARRPYLGRALFARVDFVRSGGQGALADDLGDGAGLATEFAGGGVGHLRRILLTRRSFPEEAAPSRDDFRDGGDAAGASHATIVIPTRDRGDLLDKCVASLFEVTADTAFNVVIVDNGSVDFETRAVLTRRAQHARVRVLAQPGPFNFAGLCNAGAALGSAPILVFLNDDTTVRSPDWLTRLQAATAAPGSGTVGAKLLFSDGRIQHVGVSLGIGETAGHFGAGAVGSDPGWVGRNAATHEVSAVTGACLAVERRKFEAVGGFDSENLPVELNDVDLCLRLAERSWKTVCISEASLFHEESASRGGAKFRLLKVHQKERAYFTQRWRASIRDDPFFHPGLSLFRRQPALG